MNTLKPLLSVFLILILASVIGGCDNQQAGGEQVKGLADKFWQTVQQANYDEALAFYGKDFFARQPEAAWKAHLEEIHAKLGALQSWRLKEAQINTTYSGRQYMFKFINAYEKGNATETLVFFQPVDDETVTIVAHQIQSLAL